MSLFGTSWDKIEIKRIPGIGDGPDVPGGSKRPRKLIPAVFDPKSADADSDGWRQEGTTARWYGLIPSSPIYKNVLSHFKKIKDPQNDTTWLPFGNTTVEEWLGTIDRVENGRLKAPPVELSTMEADLSFVAGHIDLKTRQAQARGVEAPSIAYESRRAAAWVKGREIQRKRFGKSSEVLSGDDESVLARADAFIDALKRKRVERDKKIAKDFELDDDTKRLARNFDITKFLDPQPDYDQWKKEWEENNPEPIRGDFATEELYEAALENWDEQRTFDYEDLIMGSDSDQELLDALDEIFSFEFETELGNKYYFSFQYQQNASQETIDLHFSVFTIGDRKVELPDGTEVELPDGSQVGNGTRTINFYDSNVYNDYFSLSDEVRGEQISTIVAARNEQIYAQMGIKEVIVGASSSEKMNGATHWPKVGFDWDNAGERDYYVELIQSALDKFSSEILDNPDELPTIAAERNDKIVSVPLFASKEEAEIVLALIEKVKTQRFDDKDRLTAGDLVNWSGAEFWFMKKGANSQLRKALGPAVAPPQVKWLRIETNVKAVNKPNLPNTPKKPGVGGGPSKPRALKPAVFDPKSVDVDNDGWHQEGTTAAWFGAGLNNPVVQELKKAFDQLGDDDRESSYNAMIATGGYGIFEGAPTPEASTPEADLAWLGGKIILNEQQQANASRNPLGGPPPRGSSSDRKLEAQWLQGRDEARRRGGVREEVVPTPEIEKLDDQTVIESIDKAITARKERRAILDAKTRVKSDDAASSESREKARAFNFEDYPPDESVELLEIQEWKEKYADPPERMEYPLGGTQEELDAYDENMRQYMRWSADSWDEYVEYRRTQEGLKHAELRNALAEIYEYEFLGNDGKTYSTTLDSAIQNESGSFSMSGKIYNESGEEVGFFDRTFMPDGTTVSHDHLKLEEGTRGSQISGILNSRNEIMYQEMGYETITLGALSGQDYNGATHWPKLGYDWLDEDQKELGLRAVEDALTEFALAIKEDPDVLPMLTKVIEDKDDPDILTEVRIPIFASREEAESVALLIAIARDQEFDDPDGLTAGDFVNWSGAELFFQQKGIQIELSRSIGGQEQSADVPDVTPDADIAVGGMSAEEIQEKNKKILNELEAAGSRFGRIDDEYKKAQEQAVAEGRVNSLHVPKTREEAIEVRKETTSATITAVRAYLETGELTPWNGRVGISESDAEVLDNMPQALRELILTSTDDELNDMILSQATRMQEEVKAGRIRVNVTDARLGNVVEDGEYKTVFSGALTENARVAGREQIDARIMGIPSDVAPELHPASGYAITREQGQVVQGNGDVEDMKLASKLTGIGGVYGGVVLELKPEVADRTSWSLGDSMNAKGFGVVRMDEDDPEYIAAVLINGSDTKKPQNVVLNMLESERNETTLTASVKSNYGDIPAGDSPESASGYDYLETNIAGSFDLDEVDSIRVPSVENLKKSAVPVASDADDLIEARFMDREKLEAAGMTEGQIAYLLELKESDPRAYREYLQDQTLQSIVYAEQVDKFGKSLFEKHGVRLLIGNEGRSPEQEVEKQLEKVKSFYDSLGRNVDRAIARRNEDARRVAEGLPTLAEEQRLAREAEDARIAAGGGLDAGGIG